MIKTYLRKSPLYVLASYSSIVIFVLYTCSYAFRKPFAAGIYEGDTFLGIDAKMLYVLFQIFGYALSKFVGIPILSSMKPEFRLRYIIGLMSFSGFSLLGFAILPIPLKIFAIFLSGLPLGMIWGIVFSYIEGRRISEVLNVGLSVALIISSGIVKTMGQFLIDTFHITEYWMPFVTGIVIFPVMIIFSFLIDQMPDPDKYDIISRTERAPMNKEDRKRFLSQFLFGIVLLVLFYGSLTVFRELRDAFAADMWKEQGLNGAMIFTKTELPISIFVLTLMFLIVFIKNNRLALNIIYLISVIGSGLMILSTLLFKLNHISPIQWMIISGLGLYMGYIPFTYLLERLIASLKVVSTAVFIMYLADSFGYLGTVFVFFIKSFSNVQISWTHMLSVTSIFTGVVSMVTVVFIYVYFKKQLNEIHVLPDITELEESISNSRHIVKEKTVTIAQSANEEV